MIGQIVDGIIGSTHRTHIGTLHQAACEHFGLLKLGVAGFPQRIGGFATDHGVNAEETAQFEMAPVIEGIADAHR